MLKISLQKTLGIFGPRQYGGRTDAELQHIAALGIVSVSIKKQ